MTSKTERCIWFKNLNIKLKGAIASSEVKQRLQNRITKSTRMLSIARIKSHHYRNW
ncbi:hypothetical protein HNY73_003639 [Argiope bruennichi]|uniref:Uncharacterized protein n=1 Tax=Argiope bruennichi TaxID=94029 RepID=A0A8T0FNR9_ARGBR|nr:hypothetical protein HNY73_003639 [Argiope bruennichi]